MAVVGSAQVRLADGSYADSLDGVVIGKMAHLQIIDADFDRTDQADTLTARAEIWRLKSVATPVAGCVIVFVPERPPSVRLVAAKPGHSAPLAVTGRPRAMFVLAETVHAWISAA